MAELVPNRVPCGKRVDPQPTPTPKPEPPVVLCELSGVTYFKLRSDIPGDYTKNCGLLGDEIDKNFYFLRSMDIFSAYTFIEDNRKYLVLQRINCGRDITVDITDEDTYDHNFRVEDGYIYVRYPGGEEDPIRDGNGQIGDGNPVKFLIEGHNVRIVTDASIEGDGLYGSPIGIDLAYRTGTYAPADFFVDLTCPEVTINDVASGIGHGHAVVTKENMSRFGALYTFGQAMAIDSALTREGRGWRIPTKDDWAKLLNWAELDPSPCDECGDKPKYLNHDTDKSGNFGCVAGSRLKSTVLWDGKANTDDFDFTVLPVGVCPENYNTREPQEDYGFTGLYKTSSFWSSSICERDGEPYVRTFSYGHDDVAQFTESPARRLSIRLVRDIVEDFDIMDHAEILGNYVPVVLTTDGTQQWTQLNINFTNYEGYKPEEVTVPQAWKDVNTDIPAIAYYELVSAVTTAVTEEGEFEVEYSYKRTDKYEMPSYAEPKEFSSVEEALEQEELWPFIQVPYIIHLDMVTETKFYYNAWDGNRWHKKMMREGESVVIINEDYESPCVTGTTGGTYVTSENLNHEWRVFVNEETGLDELIDTLDALKREFNQEFKKVWEHISGLTDDLNTLSGFVGDMYDEMQSGFTSAFTQITDLQEELDRVESGCGLDMDGNYIVPRESGLTSGSTSLRDAIGILDDVILEDEEIVANALNDLNGRVINLSGVVEDTVQRVDNIISGVGLDPDGNYIPKDDTHYLNDADTIDGISGETRILDEAIFSAMTEIGELQKRSIAPRDESIIVEVSGYTTLIGVQIADDEKHIKLSNGEDGHPGLWFDGDFAEKLYYTEDGRVTTTPTDYPIDDADAYGYI